MEWTAWLPTLISVATGVFIAGGLYNTQKTHGEKLKQHDQKFVDLEAKNNAQDIALVKLESWRDGYNAASAKLNEISTRAIL